MHRIGRILDLIIEVGRTAGTSICGVAAPLRSKAGTYGTQRMEGQQVAERRKQFPTD